MRRALSVLCLLALLATGPARSEPVTLILASDPWPQYVDVHGGYLVALSKAIFEPNGYRVKLKLMPFTRATTLLASRAVDMVPALYRVDRPGVVYADGYAAVDETSILINTSRVRWSGHLSALEGRTVAWIRGFDYSAQLQKKLQLHVRPYEVNDRQSGLAMLRQGRVDAFMDNSEELTHLGGRLNMTAPAFARVSVFRKALYFGFSDSPRGRALKVLFDRELARMAADGRLQTLYRSMVPGGPVLTGPVAR